MFLSDISMDIIHIVNQTVIPFEIYSEARL